MLSFTWENQKKCSIQHKKANQTNLNMKTLFRVPKLLKTWTF